MSTTSHESTLGQIWELAQTSSDKQPDVIKLGQPRTLGRTDDANIVLDSMVVSKIHATVGMTEGGQPFVEDLKSTNGTFVNKKKLDGRVELKSGDRVRFANLTFVVNQIPAADSTASPSVPSQAPPKRESQEGLVTSAVSNDSTISHGAVTSDSHCNDSTSSDSVPSKSEATGGTASGVSWTSAVLQFEELMGSAGVEPNYQPIVCLSSGNVVGFECLAGDTEDHVDVPSDSPVDAEPDELTNLMRRSSIDAVDESVEDPGVVIINTHPNDGPGFRMEQSLRELRRSAPNLEVAIVLKEEVVKDEEGMKKFRELLTELDIKLVYDEFGTDQERLGQLVQTPPAYLKFDINMIRNIDQSSDRHRTLVGSLVKAVQGMGITTVAEGVESKDEAKVCIELGFQFAQGSFFGKPHPISELHRPDAALPV